VAFKVINNEVITNTENGQLENLAIDGTSVLVGDGAGNVTLQNVTISGSVGIGSLDINDLGDVDTVSTPPVNGDALVWNNSTSAWEPQAPFSQADFDTAFSAKDTDDLTEGATNLYYTDERVDDRVSNLLVAGTDITLTYDDVANTLTIDSTPSGGYDLSGNTTTDLTEGTNLYYTDTRFDTRLATKSTTDLTEGTNLYYTDTRFDTRLATKTTTDLTEGTNLYYTTARANTDIDARVTTSFVNALNVTAASVQADSVTLGTNTTGAYVASIAGTTNEIEVTGSGTETAAVTIGLPDNVSITNDLVVGGDLTVSGTTVTVGSTNLSVADSFIYLNDGDAIGPAGTTFTGTGVDDAAFYGYFTGPTVTTYYVRVDSTGTPDTFEWSKDNFATTVATGVAITGGEQLLDNNIKIKFDTTTGHTSGDVWSGTASPASLDTGWWTNRNTGATGVGYTHLGVFFDVSDEKFKFVSEYDPEPTGSINTGDASFALGTVSATTFEGALSGNATTASAWQTTRTLSLTGAVTGSASIDGSGNVSLATTNTADPTLTLTGDVSGSATFTNLGNATLTATLTKDPTITLTGDVTGSGTMTNLGNVSFATTIAANSVALGTDTTGNYVGAGATSGNGISGSVSSEGGTFTVTSNATSANTANTIVFRDASRNFSAGTITANLTGNATTADTADTSREIQVYDGDGRNAWHYPLFTDSTASTLGSGVPDDRFVLQYNFFKFHPLNGDLSIPGDFTAGGDVTAYSTSDVTLKENVVAIENALNKVKAIRGVTFDWKDEVIERKGGEDGYFVRKQDVGVIAQEVEEVLPEVVATKEDGTKAVRYEKLVALLIESVKEQQNQIDSLKLEIQAIKDK
jgi:hypothetical protein